MKDNATFIYEFCYVENIKYYIDIEYGKEKKLKTPQKIIQKI